MSQDGRDAAFAAPIDAMAALAADDAEQAAAKMPQS
jgi:hypothetical protein